MKRRANVAIGIVLTGLLAAIVLDAKPWPFNNYPMFAHTVKSWPVYWARGDVAAHLALVPIGVDGDDPPREHAMSARHLAPQYPVAIMMAFNRMLGNRRPGSVFAGAPAEPGVAELRARASRNAPRLREALSDLKDRYDRRRGPDDPELVGVRLYLMKRDYDNPETLSLTDAMERGPSRAHRVLIFELMPAP